MRYAVLIFCLLAGPAGAMPPAEDPFHLTEGEKAACTDDAVRLCSSAYPDQHKLLACMKANRTLLSATCQPIFDAGIKRRHL